MSVVEATEHVASWFAQPVVRALEPGRRHLEILGDLLRRNGSAGNLTTDAHLAALAIEFGATVWSSDSDLRRFDGLSFANPLTAERNTGGTVTVDAEGNGGSSWNTS